MTSTEAASTVVHGITVEQVQLRAGRPFRASCLCGWVSEIVGARPHAIEAGRRHVDLKSATTEQIMTEIARRRKVSDGRRSN